MRTTEILQHLNRLGYVYRWTDRDRIAVACVTSRGAMDVVTGTPLEVCRWLVRTRQVVLPSREREVVA